MLYIITYQPFVNSKSNKYLPFGKYSKREIFALSNTTYALPAPKANKDLAKEKFYTK